MKSFGGMLTPFQDNVSPEPTAKGDWNGKLGNDLPDAPRATPDQLSGHDVVPLDGQGPGAAKKATIPGS